MNDTRKLLLRSTLGVLLSAFIPLSAMAQDVVKRPAFVIEKASSSISSDKVRQAQQPKGIGALTPKTDFAVSAQKSATLSKASSLRQAAASDLVGTWVMSSDALDYNGKEGNAVTVTASGDSIVLNDFGISGINVKAAVNGSSVYIPNQIVYHDTSNGDYDIALFTISGGRIMSAPNRQTLVGTIASDGSISFSSPWGIFVKSDGQNKDRFVFSANNTVLTPANATMSYTSPSGKVSFGVRVAKSSPNVLSVQNFANYGYSVEIELGRDSTATIPGQTARCDNSNGAWSTVAATFTKSGNSYTYGGSTSTITCAKATDAHTISWGQWTLLCEKYFDGVRLDGQITTNGFDIEYPKVTSTTLKGNGTAASPYLVSSANDLVLLSDLVNNSTDNNATGASGQRYSRAFAGQYIRQTADIDMDGYRMTPIGRDGLHQFGGNYDGNGHTISNFSVRTTQFAGLFGRVDTVGVIRNLNIANASVASSGQFTGTIAGIALGKIINCSVTNSEVTGADNAVGGIAGYVQTMDSCNVQNSTITAQKDYGGGLAGETQGSISHSYASGVTIIASGTDEGATFGGIAGDAYGTISDCHFVGNIDGTASKDLVLGGIAGMIVNGSIDRCYFAGTISGDGDGVATDGVTPTSGVGGIAGVMARADMRNCYSIGRISAPASRRVGGLTGRIYKLQNVSESTISNSYTAATILAETYQYEADKESREVIGRTDDGANPTFTNIYYDRQITNFGSTKYGTITDSLTSGLVNLPSSVWTTDGSTYPRLKGQDSDDDAYFSTAAVHFNHKGFVNSVSTVSSNVGLSKQGATQFLLVHNGRLDTTGNGAKIVNDSLVIGSQFATDTLVVIRGNADASARNTYYYILNIAPVSFAGTGTATDPFLLKTKADMLLLANATTVHHQRFGGATFQMANDIDMEYDTTFKGISADGSLDASSIGFEGTFDGAGHALRRLAINGIIWKTQPNGYVGDGTGDPDNLNSPNHLGVFGRINRAGVVKNLIIPADARLTFWSLSGAIAGQNYGHIENCRNYADVIGLSSWIGGIAGRNESDGVISGCLNTGNIKSGYEYCGGITGTNEGLIEKSMNTGVVSTGNYSEHHFMMLEMVGGIAGSCNGGIFHDVANSGMVTAYRNRAGGISGTLEKHTAYASLRSAGNNDMRRAINWGTVFAQTDEQSGAIGGSAGSQGDLGEIYWDKQIVTRKANGGADLNGAQGVETSVLTSGQPLQGFSTDTWTFRKGSYPVLKAFDSDSTVIRAASTLVQLKSGEVADNVKSNIILTLPVGASATLKAGDVMHIDGSTVVIPEVSSAIVTDTLVITDGRYTKIIPLKQVYEMPLSGEGTKTSPYLITNTSEWNALADYISATKSTLSGIYVKVANDIDFTGVTFKPIGSSATESFDGDFDGGGHTVSGINYTVARTSRQQQGLFRTIGESGVLHDITLRGHVKSDYGYTGGVVGSVYGTLRNVKAGITLTATGQYSAGVVGHAYGTAKFINCEHDSLVTSSNTYVAGFVALADSSAYFSNCGNNGKIIYTGTSSYAFAGGFAAKAEPITFNHVYNSGNVSVESPSRSSTVAGLIATTDPSDAPFRLTGCWNSGNITGNGRVAGLTSTNLNTAQFIIYADSCWNSGTITASSSYAGGITARYSTGSHYTNCYNEGDINAASTDDVGGLLGGWMSSGGKTIVYNCHNTGSVKGRSTVGGITGFDGGDTEYTNTWNEGTVSGSSAVGGISGFTMANTKFTNCWNSGSITAGSVVGGILGQGTPAGITVSNSFNVGSVGYDQSSSSASGDAIGGIAGRARLVISDSYNAGEVTGKTATAGIIGKPYNSSTSIVIQRVYNAGTINANNGGNIIGTTEEWNADNSISNTYYITDLGQTSVDKAITATGIAASQIGTMSLGSAFTKLDDASLPIINGFGDNEAARLYAAFVVPAEGQTFNHITSNVSLGMPEGVLWTSSVPQVSVSGGRTAFTEPYTGELILTSKLGDFSRQFKLNVAVTDGITNINVNADDADSKLPEYTPTGVRVSNGYHGIVIQGKKKIIKK